MNKTAKGILAGLATIALAAGVVYAAYTVVTPWTSSDLVEPISTAWVNELPKETYPNQTYDVRLEIANVDNADNGNQLVGVKVLITNLDPVDVWVQGLGWGQEFDATIPFTLANGATRDVVARVRVPSDQSPDDDPAVTFEVSRE